MQPSFVVGVTGCSGSGKTFVLNSLLAQFRKGEVTVLSQDNYYHPGEKQPVDENGIVNYDLPESIQLEEFRSDIIRIKHGEKLVRKEYTYNNFAKQAGIIEARPAPIIFVEGIFIFSHSIIDDQLDYRIFVDAEIHTRLQRRIHRDFHERGYDSNDVTYRYWNHVMPAYKKYIEPYRHKADVIINNNRNGTLILDDLISFLQTKSG